MLVLKCRADGSMKADSKPRSIGIAKLNSPPKSMASALDWEGWIPLSAREVNEDQSFTIDDWVRSSIAIASGWRR